MGYSVQKIEKTQAIYADIVNEEFWEIYNVCKPYTMTSVERLYSLYSCVDYVLKNNIPGDFVECGVWRGGSSMLIAKMLSNRAITNRKIYLYDTFEGMSAPLEVDETFRGDKADRLMDEGVENKEESVWCLASLEDVQNNLKLTKFPLENTVYIKGKVEDTIPQHLPTATIALLRLDTDWYESTKHELTFMYPMLEQNGILFIDDYGHWKGCRKAVDEYFAENNKPAVLLNRVDYTARMVIKQSIN